MLPECGTGGHAAAALPTEAREGCPGLVGDPCARQLDGGVDGRRLADDHLKTVDGDANVCAGAKQKVSAMSLEVMDTGSRLKDALSDMRC